MIKFLENSKGRPEIVSQRAMIALGGRKDKKASRILIKILKNDSSFVSRVRATSALGKIKDPSAEEALKDALEDKDFEVRKHSSDALRKITGKEYKFKGKDAVQPVKTK